MGRLRHFDKTGKSKMVDTTGKKHSLREAKAQAVVILNKKILELIVKNKIEKGNVLEVAKIAGVFACKKTSFDIPFCHPLQISHVDINFDINHDLSVIKIETIVKANERTGVEMEALNAAATTALTIYDMCKSIDKTICITDIKLLEKRVGKKVEKFY